MNISMDIYLKEDLEKVVKSDLIPWNELKGKNIWITGATGFIGSLLCRSFLYANQSLDLGVHIYGVVRNIRKAETMYGTLLDRSDFELFNWDLRDPIKENIETEIDFIFHCASVTVSRDMVDHPVETLLTSVDGTHNILELAKRKKVKSFVYLSSMEVYGVFKDSRHCVTEEDLGYINPLLVRSNYPEGKRLCENMCIAYFSEYGIPVKIARLAQTFGAGVLADENRVFAQFARCVRRKEDIILHTQGMSEGNYCYSRDAIKALILLLLRGNNGEAYNISNPDMHTTILDMAKMVCTDIAEGRISIVYDIPESNLYGYAQDTKLKLDSGKMQRLGWIPEVGLYEAYMRMIGSLDMDANNVTKE